MAAVDATTVASLTAPHMLYALIWFLPGLWKRAFSKPVRAFKFAATIGKGLLLILLDVVFQHAG